MSLDGHPGHIDQPPAAAHRSQRTQPDSDHCRTTHHRSRPPTPHRFASQHRHRQCDHDPVSTRTLEKTEPRQPLDQRHQTTGRVEQRQRPQQQPEHAPPIRSHNRHTHSDRRQQQRSQPEVQVGFTLVRRHTLNRRIGSQCRRTIHRRRIPLEGHHRLGPIPRRNRTELQRMLLTRLRPLTRLAKLPRRQQLHRRQPDRQQTRHQQHQPQPPTRPLLQHPTPNRHPVQAAGDIHEQDQLSDPGQLKMSGQHLHRQHHRQHTGKTNPTGLQQTLNRPQRRRQPRPTNDRPLPTTAAREPAVHVHQSTQKRTRTNHSEAPRVTRREHKRQHIVQQVTETVGRVDVQPGVERQVRRIEHARLTLGQHRIPMTDPVVPERRQPLLQLLGEEHLLREIVRVDVTTNETASGDQRPPEQRGQGNPQQPHHHSKSTVGQRIFTGTAWPLGINVVYFRFDIRFSQSARASSTSSGFSNNSIADAARTFDA